MFERDGGFPLPQLRHAGGSADPRALSARTEQQKLAVELKLGAVKTPVIANLAAWNQLAGFASWTCAVQSISRVGCSTFTATSSCASGV